jgi:hypothetical protein
MGRRKLAAAGRLAAIIAVALASTACATIVNGRSQDLYVETQPDAASCKIDRQGATVGVVNPTPGKTSIPRHKDNIVVSCALDGYETSNEILASNFSGVTFGNLLLGGFVGVVIDASSGANNKYPEKITVILTPATFPSDAARDLYFDGVKSRLSSMTEAEVKRLDATCSSNTRDLCRSETKQILEARDKALIELDRKRLAAKVMPTS